MSKPTSYFDFLRKVKSHDTPSLDWLKRPLVDTAHNSHIPMYGNHFQYGNPSAYLLDYSRQQYLHFDEAASRSLTGYNSSYLLKGGLEAGLSLWDKADLDVYDQQVLPTNLNFLSSVPINEIPDYLFECTYRVKTKEGDIKTVLQKSFFLHSIDEKLPTLVCGYLFDITPYKTDNSVLYRIHKSVGNGIYHQVKDDLFFPAYEDRILSKRETEVLQGFCYHYSIKQIAEKLHISPYTVKNHLKNIRRKVDCSDDAELYIYARTKGLLGR